MKNSGNGWFGVLMLAMVVLPAVSSSAGSAGLDGDSAAELRDLGRKMEAFVNQSRAFVKDVRITDKDVQDILKLHQSLEQLETKSKAWGEMAFQQGEFDFEALSKDSDYVAWAKAHQVPAKEFMQKVMRLQLFYAREEAVKSEVDAKRQIAEQLKELEGVRAQLEEVDYRNLRQMLETSSSMVAATQNAFSQLPAPTTAEGKLLKKYDAQLRKALDMDGDNGESDQEQTER